MMVIEKKFRTYKIGVRNLKILIVLLFLMMGLFFRGKVRAGDEVCTEDGNCKCWGTTVVNQYTCTDNCDMADCCSEVGCYKQGGETVGKCTNDLGEHPCGPGEGQCIPMCVEGSTTGDCEIFKAETLACNTSPGVCQSESFDGCHMVGETCVDDPNDNVKGCCGPGGTCGDGGSVGCNVDCSGGETCAGSNNCIGGVCRNPNCSSETDCSCPSAHGCYEDCSDGMGCIDGNVCQDVGGVDICVNSSCPLETDCSCPANGDITGSVYLLDSGATTIGGSGTLCSLSSGTANLFQPGVGSLVTVNLGGYTGSVLSGGGFTVAGVPSGIAGTYSAGLTIGDSNYICTCPFGCSYGSIIGSPMTGVDFFVTNQRDAWFQVDGGNIHANGGSVSSDIPSSATNPYLITGDTGLVSYTNSLGLGDGGINESGKNWRAITSYDITQTDYDYFYRILSDDPMGMTDWDGSEPVNTGVFKSDVDLRTIGGDWNIIGGQKSVLLVDGDVVIDQNINVAVGSFLAIIASGNITVADTVTDTRKSFPGICSLVADV